MFQPPNLVQPTLIVSARLFYRPDLVSILLISACSAPWQHGKTASASSSKPTTKQLLANMQKSFRSVTAFHVVMQTQNAGKAGQGQIQIRNAEGDVVMPDKV